MIDLETLTVTNVAEMFVPVIFANGEDDDLPGLAAAVENRHVQFDDRIYKPGEELIIDRRHLYLSRGIFIVGAKADWPVAADEWFVVREADPGRPITISNCYLDVPNNSNGTRQWNI